MGDFHVIEHAVGPTRRPKKGRVLGPPRRVSRLCVSLSGPAAPHPVPSGGAAIPSPKGKLKNKISKKFRLRLARGVGINSVTF